MGNKHIGSNWQDVRKEIFTPEEIAECDRRVQKAMEKSAVVIFRDGRKMTATYVRGEEEVAMATAKCNPSDKFDYAVGANLAVTRLMKQVQRLASSKKRRK